MKILIFSIRYIQGLGRINQIGFGLQGQKNRIIVSTEENVIASLKLNSDLGKIQGQLLCIAWY